MSRHPSPGPSHPGTQNSQQPPSAPSARRSRPTHSIGIAAGAEDVKYQAKYKDLKRKVKEIEGENDKLQFKILQAKRSLQRMRLERAILYERLVVPSPTVDPHDRHSLNQVPPLSSLPPPPQQPSRSYSGSHPSREARDRPIPMESDTGPVDYHRQHGNSRLPGSDSNRPPVPTMDPPSMGGGPSPHMSSVQPPRRNSAHDTMRHLPPLSHLPPVGQYEGAAGRSHSLPHPASPPVHHSHPNSSPHDMGRTHSSRSHQPPPPPPQNYPGVPSQQYSEPLPPVQRVLRSPPPHSDRDRPPRRLEGNEYPTHNESHMQHSRHSSQLSPNLHSADARASSNRAHSSHQRMGGGGPGAYINREDSIPRQYELERDKGRDRDSRGDWERDARGREPSSGGGGGGGGSSRDMNPNIHSPHTSHRRAPPPPPPPSSEYQDYPPHSHHPHHTQGLPPRIRDEQGYYHDGNPYPSVHASRSDTPGSGSGSGTGAGEELSRPDSRTQFYDEHNRPSSYRLRPVSQSNNIDDVEFSRHDDTRSRDHANASSRQTSSTTGGGGGGGGKLSGSGSNNGTSGNSAIGGGGDRASYTSVQHATSGSGIPPPMSSGGIQDRAQSSIETSRKRSRNEMEMDVDDDENDVAGGKGEPGSRRNTPGPGYSGSGGGGGGSGGGSDRMLQAEDRDRGSSKRYQREHPHHRNENREGSLPPPSSSTAAAGSGPQD